MTSLNWFDVLFLRGIVKFCEELAQSFKVSLILLSGSFRS